MMPQLSAKIWGLASGKARGDWEQVVFSISRKRSAGKNVEVFVKNHQLFLSVHEIDHLSNISMNRTVAQLAENSGEKKELLKEFK